VPRSVYDRLNAAACSLLTGDLFSRLSSTFRKATSCHTGYGTKNRNILASVLSAVRSLSTNAW